MSKTADSPFRAALALAPRDGGWSARFGEDWSQGRAIFGGMVGAAALAAMRREVAPDRAPRALVANFVGPVEPLVEVSVTTELLRVGRSATQVQARLVQNGTPRFVATAVFGGRRPSAVEVEPPPPPELPPVESLVDMPYLEGVTPAFTRHLAFRWGRGQPPFSGGDEATIGGWVRLRQPAGPADAEACLALLDAWPDPTLSLLNAPAPSSSMSWSVTFWAEAGAARADDWWRYEARTLAAADGYVHTRSALWDADGRPLAADEQVVAIFDR